MLTKRDIDVLLEVKEIKTATESLKFKFIAKEAEFLTISNHDFLALVFLTPSLQIAAADRGISLSEELNLNRKARALSSKRGLFGTNPVVFTIKFLIKNLAYWEESFTELIKLCMEVSFSKNMHVKNLIYSQEAHNTVADFNYLDSPHGFIQFLSSLFLKVDQGIDEKKRIKSSEYQAMKNIGGKLGLNSVPLFNKFCDTYEVK